MPISEIKKRDGRIVKFEPDKIKNAIDKAITAVKHEDGELADKLADNVVNNLEKMFTKKIPSVEDVQNFVEEVLIRENLADVAKAYILYREKHKEIREAREFFGVKDGLKLTINAARVLERRYLLKDKDGKVVETPHEMFRRLAKAVAKAEKNKDSAAKCEEGFYRILSNLEFLPNSPTLMNAGTSLGMLSACFVIPVSDSLDSIFEAVKTTALIQQAGGGTGFTFAHLRPKGDMVQSTKGVASGPVSFIRVFDTTTDVIKQGSKRRGANMGILNVDHPDITEFITSKAKEDEFVNFNFSVGVNDKFMKAARKGKDYSLINPRTGAEVGKLNAAELFDMICMYAWRTGDPGLIFFDTINKKNPLVKNFGPIEATNPCISGDALISTDKGLERFEDIVNSNVKILVDNRVPIKVSDGYTEQYILMGDQNNVSLREATATFDSGIKETLKLVTKSGYEVTATPDHKIMTTEGWVKMEDLSETHKVLIQCKEGKFNKDYNLPFIPDNLVIGKNGRAYRFNLPRKWSKELGQILGWLVGDGHFRTGKEHRAAWIFGKQDYPVMDYLKPLLENIYDGKPTEQLKLRGVKWITFHSKFFANFLLRLGVKPVLADEKEVPKSVFTAPKEVVIGFLQGLFTSDGTVNYVKNKSSYVRVTSKSEKLLKQVQLLLLNLGIKSRIYDRHKEPKKKFFYITVKGEQRDYTCDGRLFELEVSKDSAVKFLDEIGFLCGRHDDKVSLLNSKTYYSNYFIDKVKKVEGYGKTRVYDLTESLTHSFISNGIVVSNCGEVGLYPYESCNLGSINLAKFVKDNKIDWDRLKEIVKVSTRFLDNVIDVNKYPIKEIEKVSKDNRRIGLGVMGFAEMLIQLGIPYDSKDAVKTASKLMKFINSEAVKTSEELAKEKSEFPNFSKSSFKKKRRNVAVTTIAPTGTISILAGCSSGIEPLFAITFIRNVMGGTRLVEINPYFENIAKERGFYSESLMGKVARTGSVQKIEEVPEDVKRIFKTALDIDPEWHVRIQAAFQEYTENAVSKTINFPHESSVEDVKKAYLLAYKLGCKGITIYRYGSKKEQVLYLGTVIGREEGETMDFVSAESEYSGGCPFPSCPH
ncbi:ribonucleoside reductase class II [Candidatus Woesearchaeota archaeon]|nr:ribonucleoside reductase class II [Candidatus Woesearchaeota archaeon]